MHCGFYKTSLLQCGRLVTYARSAGRHRTTFHPPDRIEQTALGGDSRDRKRTWCWLGTEVLSVSPHRWLCRLVDSTWWLLKEKNKQKGYGVTYQAERKEKYAPENWQLSNQTKIFRICLTSFRLSHCTCTATSFIPSAHISLHPADPANTPRYTFAPSGVTCFNTRSTRVVGEAFVLTTSMTFWWRTEWSSWHASVLVNAQNDSFSDA